jgi:flagellar motor switch/type III secretory pathway protein FliN
VSAAFLDGLDGGRLRLGGTRVELAAEPTPVETASREAAPMTDSANPTGETMQVPVFGQNPIADVLAEMPVEIRVEAGTVTMPARAWAAMGTGDVVVLDRRVGESVTLRVGGTIVGRGELVDVDGNLGVRLIERSP